MIRVNASCYERRDLRGIETRKEVEKAYSTFGGFGEDFTEAASFRLGFKRQVKIFACGKGQDRNYMQRKREENKGLRGKEKRSTQRK